MVDFSHLNAIEERRHFNEMILMNAKTELTFLNKNTGNKRRKALLQNEINYREHNLKMIEKEIAGERKHLGLEPEEEAKPMTDDELLAALGDIDDLLK